MLVLAQTEEATVRHAQLFIQILELKGKLEEELRLFELRQSIIGAPMNYRQLSDICEMTDALKALYWDWSGRRLQH